MQKNSRQSTSDTSIFLPDFCAVGSVFMMVLLVEVLAFVITLAGGDSVVEGWTRLSLVSLFCQWTALTAAAVLCITRPYLVRAGDIGAAGAAFAILLTITGVYSVLALEIFDDTLHIGLSGTPAYFISRNLAIATIIGALTMRYLYVQHQWKRNLQAESDARLAALQARIRPHFLFNSMNIIASLTRSDPVRAETVVEDLSDLFRATLAEPRNLVPLDEELDHARRYLNIEALRLGDRLRIDWDLTDDSGGAHLPALTLQPLLENAVYHGIEPRPEGGTISVQTRVKDRCLHLSVTNPLPNTTRRGSSGNQMALDNIRQRLSACFERADLLQVTEADGIYRVSIDIPLAGSCAS